MNATVLRVGTYPNGWRMLPCGMLNLKPRPLCPMPGVDAQLLYTVLATLAIPYELVPFQDAKIGYYEENQWKDGIFAELQNGNIDVIASEFVETELRKLNFSFSYPISHLDTIIVTGRRDEDFFENAGLLFHVFGKYVWLALVLCYAFYSLSIRVAPRLASNFSFNLICTVLGLGIVLFVNLYADCLLAQLLHPTVSYKVKNVWHMAELIEGGEIQLLVPYEGSIEDETVKHSIDPFYKQLRKAVAKNPVLYLGDDEGWESKVVSGQYVVADTDDNIANYVQSFCHTRIIKDRDAMHAYTLGLMFRKEFHMIKTINSALVALQQNTYNLFEKYRHWQARSYGHCERKWAAKNEALGVISLSGAFLTLFGGFLVCSLFLVLEFVTQKWRTCGIVQGRTRNRKYSNESVEVAVDDSNPAVAQEKEEEEEEVISEGYSLDTFEEHIAIGLTKLQVKEDQKQWITDKISDILAQAKFFE